MQIKSGRNILIGIVLLTSIILTTIVYSAFNTQLNIEGEAIVRSDQDIRITNISISNTSNGAYETYNNKYNKDTTFMYVTLPASSSITYTVEITNKYNFKYVISNIVEQSHTNSNITYSINERYIVANSNSAKNFMITLTNNTTTEQVETLILKYTFEKAQSTFLSGTIFNTKIKQLAGDTNPSNETPNTTITSIRRTNQLTINPSNENIVSISTSNVPIYAWYDNGTIYWFSYVDSPYMNSNAQDMFQYLKSATSIDINTIDTSRVTTMQGLFHIDTSLENIDLSNFNTENVTNMYAPFKDCINLTSLDLSSFNMTNVTNTTQMLYNMSSLTQLKTPNTYPSSTSIKLPKTMYDSNNNSYTILNSSSPTNTLLTDGQ